MVLGAAVRPVNWRATIGTPSGVCVVAILPRLWGSVISPLLPHGTHGCAAGFILRGFAAVKNSSVPLFATVKSYDTDSSGTDSRRRHAHASVQVQS